MPIMDTSYQKRTPGKSIARMAAEPPVHAEKANTSHMKA